MIYIETNSTDVFYNFAVEHYLAAVKPREEMLFLLWRTTPTLMIGKYQNPYEEIDVAYAKEQGIEIVRRPSGGGTIFTDLGGWQFSFIDPDGAQEIEFSKYTGPILDALQALGVPVTFTGRNDLLVDGKKISGNAQYKIAGRTVHHGSLLFDTALETMEQATKLQPHKIQSKSIQSVRDRVTNISEHLAHPMTVEAFHNHLVQYLTGGHALALTAEDVREISRIADEMFRDPAVIFGKTPKFSIEREKRFAGGMVQLHMDVVKGRIREAKIYGDFFATEELEELLLSLQGVLYEKEHVRQALSESVGTGAIYGVSVDELADLIVSG